MALKDGVIPFDSRVWHALASCWGIGLGAIAHGVVSVEMLDEVGIVEDVPLMIAGDATVLPTSA